MTDAPDASDRAAADVAAAKRTVRAALLAARRARPASELGAARAAVADVVLARAAERGWRCVAAYEPLRTEPGSVELLRRLVAAGVEVLVPDTLPDRDLDWLTWPAPGRRLGLDAIGRADAVLVPALAVAADGVRLGRGGGSYDRALLRCAPTAERIALVFADELVATLPAEAWDVPVTAAVTPSGHSPLATRRVVAPQRNTTVAPDR